MFADTCPFYLKISVAALHIAGTICALHQGAPRDHSSAGSFSHPASSGGSSSDSAFATTTTVADSALLALYYLYSPLLRPLLSVVYRVRGITAGGSTEIFCSLAPLVACCTVLGALLPHVLVVRQTPAKSDITARRIVACVAYACFCSHACAWVLDASRHHHAFEWQARALVCALQLHAATHNVYQCLLAGNFAAAPVYLCGLGAIHLLCLVLPMAAWTTVARSPQDILMVHALVAFCPEVLGTAFDAAVQTVQRLLD